MKVTHNELATLNNEFIVISKTLNKKYILNIIFDYKKNMNQKCLSLQRSWFWLNSVAYWIFLKNTRLTDKKDGNDAAND